MKELLGSSLAVKAKAPCKRPKRKRRFKVILALFLSAFLLVGTLVSVNTFAALNQTNAVHIDPAAIENSTLIIGSHLIHLSALTDTTYATASQSVLASEQASIYYKSELAGGAWFDITTANGIAEISTAGTPVPNSFIAGLWFTHHTRSNGITYNLLTGQPINIFDTPNPYDLHKLEELMPLELQYQHVMQSSSSSSGSNSSDTTSADQNRNMMMFMNRVWSATIRSSVTNDADTALGQLQNYFQHLATTEAPTRDKDALQKVMGSYDALRRHEVMQILEGELQTLVQRASTNDPIKPAYTVDVALVSASNDSLRNVSSSKAAHAGNMMEIGSTLTSQLYYKYCSSLVSSAAPSDWTTCNTHLAKIILLTNIMEDVIEDAPAESALLMDALLGPGMDKYATRLRQGVSAEYTSAQNTAEPQAVLDGIASSNTSVLNSNRMELQYLIDAYCMRIENAAALDYLAGLLKEGTGLYNVVPNDAFSSGAKSSIDAYIDYLSTKQRDLELAGGGNALDATKMNLSGLEEQRLSALDEGDLAKAKALEDELAKLQAQMNAQLADMASQINDLNAQMVALSEKLKTATDAEKAALENELAALRAQIDAMRKSVPSGSLLELLQRLLAECKAILNNMSASAADLAALRDRINSLMAMMELDLSSAYAALQELLVSMELSREARGDNALDADMKTIDDTLAQYRDAYYASLSGTLSGDEFESIGSAFFEGKLQGPDGSTLSVSTPQSNLNDEEKEVVRLLAADMVVKNNNNPDIRTWLDIRLQREVLAGNILIFEPPRSTSEQYVPTEALAKLCGMRYVWNGNVGRVTLSQGGQYYVFHGYTNEVELSEQQGGSTLMPSPAVVQNGLYVPASYAKEEFAVTSVYFDSGSSPVKYGAAANDTLYALAEQLYAAVMA